MRSLKKNRPGIRPTVVADFILRLFKISLLLTQSTVLNFQIFSRR